MGSAGHSIEARLFINGKFTESSDKKTFKLISPTSLDVIANVYEASVEDANDAVAAAKAAFPAWSALSPKDRGAYLHKLAALIIENNEELAYLEAISMGRPLGAFFDAHYAADHFSHYAEMGWEAQGKASLNTPGMVNMTFRQPFGVAAAIIPWNAPLIFFASKIAPAIMAGNTIVLKSSEKAPLTSLKAASLVEKAGFPPGVINVLSGHGAISGQVLSSHMDVRIISFTGSMATGKRIQEAAAKSNLKNVLLELGGKSPALVFEDCDLEATVKDTQFSMQWNSGQVCMANSRIYVQDTIAEKFIATFKTVFGAAKLGDPTKEGINHGPQVDGIQHEKILKYIEEGKKSGKLILGGERDKSLGKGYFVAPTAFVDTPEDAKIMREEVFGPVVNINVFHTEEEALQKANNTEFGLYAAVFTKNIDRAMRVAKALEAGSVGINCTSPTIAFDMPFGGWKGSGLGREGIEFSLGNYLEVKAVYIKLGDA